MNTTDDVRCEETKVHAKALEEARSRLPNEIELSDLAEFFRIFGDSTRIRILSSLYECELCVCDLAELLGASSSAVSHQLAILRANKLVKYRREGKTVFYSLADSHVHSIIAQGMEHVAE